MSFELLLLMKRNNFLVLQIRCKPNRVNAINIDVFRRIKLPSRAMPISIFAGVTHIVNLEQAKHMCKELH
jgi:hypothetical protein